MLQAQVEEAAESQVLSPFAASVVLLILAWLALLLAQDLCLELCASLSRKFVSMELEQVEGSEELLLDWQMQELLRS